MRFSTSAMVLSTLIVGEAAATAMHGKAHNHAMRHADMLKGRNLHREKRDLNLLNAIGGALLTTLGFAGHGSNPTGPSGTSLPWIGDNGAAPYTNTFYNQADEDCVLTIWGAWGSWVNAVVPQITVSIPANSSQVISFPSGWSGAWAPVYPDTKLVNGQIFETWGEGTLNGIYSTVDVSREVNMGGRNMAIVGPQCTSDMNKCSFVCPEGQSSCMTGYKLQSCSTSEQAGANYGTFDGADSGGCSGMGDSAHLKTFMGWTH